MSQVFPFPEERLMPSGNKSPSDKLVQHFSMYFQSFLDDFNLEYKINHTYLVHENEKFDNIIRVVFQNNLLYIVYYGDVADYDTSSFAKLISIKTLNYSNEKIFLENEELKGEVFSIPLNLMDFVK